jgi:Spy/CpxP family protein refolding chaperone
MKHLLPIITALTAANLTFTMPAFAANGKNTLPPAQAEAEYTHVIDLRSRKIVDALGLTDTNKAAKVHAIIMAQYRALNSWHNTNDSRIKAAHHDPAATAKINEPLRKLHDEYLANLAQYLTPEQIEMVKDKMTYNKVEVTYNAYCEIVPDLTAPQKAEILELLKQARDEAMDCGSSEEKSAVFKKYKGKINNYLTAQGHDVHKAYQEWGERQKMKAAENSGPVPAE